LNKIVNELGRATTNFEYDAWDNLVSGTYNDKSGAETIYKAPDAIGNLFKTPERKDRQYDKGGKLLKDDKYYYHYDAEGNLIFKEFITSGYPALFGRKDLEKKLDIKLKGAGIGWLYEWSGNGMLKSVTLPQGSKVAFNYDPLGRRIAKQYKERVTRWLWDGNVPLHEWQYDGEYPPKLSIDETDRLKEEQEPTENVITWLFEEGSFVPCGKIVNNEQYSIVTDYLGTPNFIYNAQGEKVWECTLDVYGKVRNLQGSFNECPFKFAGQYYDNEIDLCYTRFRYYCPNNGTFISQDIIGLLSEEVNFYSYVRNSNSQIDSLGLSSTDLKNDMMRGLSPVRGNNMQFHHVIPEAVWNSNSKFFNDIGLGGQRDKAFNGIMLPNSPEAMKDSGLDVYHRGSHKNYNDYVGDRVTKIKNALDDDLISKTEARKLIRKLQMEMKNKIGIGDVSTGHTKIKHSKRLH
jgi:RHS repeat-associated protein